MRGRQPSPSDARHGGRAARAMAKFLSPWPLRLARHRAGGRDGTPAGGRFTIEDLLPRQPIDLDDAPVRRIVTGRRVMVTGAGGSIGTELCRQLAGYEPQGLALVERHENSLYEIATDLADRGVGGPARCYVADVTDAARMARVIGTFQPHVIFHAAAHKHVPMMELNPSEAVKNNVGGTRVLVDEASRAGVERLVLISTDKAVNPTSVMGATKRVAELCIQARAGLNGIRLCAVRFGNVLASNGSVVPRFLAQIRAGGPVTVTDPDMRRYFILISEAVQLVQQAAALAEPGAVYVLDMGEQVKVADLARRLILASGLVPDRDIRIQFVGARPGEKLREELVDPDEAEELSPVEKIRLVRPLAVRWPAELDAMIDELTRAAGAGEEEGVLRHLQLILPAFVPARASHHDAPALFPAARPASGPGVAERSSSAPGSGGAPRSPSRLFGKVRVPGTIVLGAGIGEQTHG